MKHIKLFESFEVYRLKQEIGDILAELSDDGIRVDTRGPMDAARSISVCIFDEEGSFTHPIAFTYSKIRHDIEHLISFLKTNGYIIDTMYNKVSLSQNSHRISYKDLQDDTPIGRLEMYFRSREEMKHYKLFESIDKESIVPDIRDIFAYLSDSGDIKFKSNDEEFVSSMGNDVIWFDVLNAHWKGYKVVEYDNKVEELVECFETLTSYLSSKNLVYTIIYRGHDRRGYYLYDKDQNKFVSNNNDLSILYDQLIDDANWYNLTIIVGESAKDAIEPITRKK